MNASREEAINALFPELNDIGAQLNKSYKLLNENDISWIFHTMGIIKLRAESVVKQLERLGYV